MIFEGAVPAKISSVLELRWTAGRRFAQPRPYHALSYRMTGHAEFIHDKASTQVKQGDIAFVPAGYDYTLDSVAEHLYVVHFDLYQPMEKKMKVFTPTNANLVENLFQKMYAIWRGKQIGYENATAAVFYKLMEQIQKQRTDAKLTQSSDMLKTVVAYLHEHFTDSDLSVGLLCKMAGMSDTYFRRLFVRNFSVTPLRYINNLRLSYAQELLRSGYYTIEHIAEMVGFSDPKYFSTFIKKEFGVSPSSLRKKI